MKAHWAQVKDKWGKAQTLFNGFALRERALMAGALFALVYLLWDFIFIKPINDEATLSLALERNALTNITAGDAELTVLKTLSERDPDAEIKRELLQLQEKLQSLDTQLSTLSVGLVKAAELPVMLHQMLAQTQKMQMLSLTTMPAEVIELQADNDDAVEEGAATEMARLYKHGVQVKLEGSYSATYQLIKALEDSQWQFYWDSFDYHVQEYPNAVVTLRLFALASDKGVLDTRVMNRNTSAP